MKKDYVKDKLGLSFQDERLQFALQFCTSIGHARKQIKKMIKLFPKHCLKNIQKGLSCSYIDDKKRVEAVYKLTDNHQPCLELYYKTNKIGYEIIINYGMFGKDLNLLDLKDEFFMEYENFLEPDICMGDIYFNTIDSDYYTVGGPRCIISERDWNDLEFTIRYPYFKLNKMQELVSQLPHTLEEYRKFDEEKMKKENVEEEKRQDKKFITFTDMVKHAIKKKERQSLQEDSEVLAEDSDMSDHR